MAIQIIRGGDLNNIFQEKKCYLQNDKLSDGEGCFHDENLWEIQIFWQPAENDFFNFVFFVEWNPIDDI